MPVPSAITGAVTGVVLLGGVVAFAVGLPEAVGDQPAATGAADQRPVAELLPASMLDGDLQRIADIDPQFEEMADQVESYGTDKLTEVFGADVAVARYATADLQSEVSITIYDGESPFFVQQGPPLPPELTAGGSVVSDTTRIGESVCFGQWQTEAFQQDAPPFQTQCQQVADGRTFNAYAGGGLSLEQTAEILDDAVAQAAE
jgi:hypothetical protein